MVNQGIKGTNGIPGEEPQIYTSTKRALITKSRTMNILANGGITLSGQF